MDERILLKGTSKGDSGESNLVDPILVEAQNRFQRCMDWESNARKLFLDDVKFANADPDNGYQWPNDIRKSREIDKRPSLTINKVRQHNLQIINDAKQNKPGIAIRAVGNGATKESADALEGVVRHIEYISNAQTAYDIATEFQVTGGIGYWRVVTDYAADDTFDQEIFIRQVKDPTSIFIDPDIQQRDGSDASFAFVFSEIPKDEFKQAYPKYADMAGDNVLGVSGWITKEHVRVAEYFRRLGLPDKLVSFQGTDGVLKKIKKSQLPDELYQQLLKDPSTKVRDIVRIQVEWFLIVGEAIAERRDWPGIYIPIIRVIGEEVIIEGKLDRKGHTRALKDPQRMYNFWSSSAVEGLSLQTKTPYIGETKAFEGFETLWENANTENKPFLPYNGWDDDGNRPIQPPKRTDPADIAPGYLKGVQLAGQEMMLVSGQYESQMGQPGNERTAKAISERQRQGDRATYHFIDNLALAIRFTGKILLDLIPKIYDTSRVLSILAEDQTDYEIEIDPQAKQAFSQRKNYDNVVVQRVLNPNIGVYDVQAEVGPSYATQREEAFNALTLILTQAPQLTGIIGDILFRAGDFPLSEEAAARLKRMVPKEALGEGPSQAEQQLQQQVQNLTSLLTKNIEELSQAKIKLKGKEEMRYIDAYDSETKRMAALANMLPLDQEGVKKVIEDLVMQALQTHLGPLFDNLGQTLNLTSGGQEQEPMIPGLLPQGAPNARPLS